MVYNLVFIMKMTVYTIWLVWLKGRASAISFYGWGYSGCRESETLIVSIFEKLYFTQANYICRYLDLFLWLLVNRESDYSSRTSGQPGITALPRITADD